MSCRGWVQRGDGMDEGRREVNDLTQLADHFWEAADASDVGHVMWLNRHVGIREMARDVLRDRLEEALRR